jgi:hypothetical protein
MAPEVEHDEVTVDRREDQLPELELPEQSRTNPAGLGVMVESRDEQQKLVEVENPFQ